METLTRDEYFPNPDMVVSVLPRSPQQYFPEHVHEFDELVIARSGSGMNYINGKPAPICRGSVFYVRAAQTHYMDQLDDLYLTNVLILPGRFKHVSHETVANLLADKSDVNADAFVVGGATLKRVEGLLNRIAEESDNKVEYSDQMIELMLGQLMIELWRGQPQEKSSQSERDARLTSLLRHLNGHFDEEVDWDQLAERFDIPLRTLSRKISDVTGMSPNQYLTRIRMCHAMRLLAETEQSVTDIAFACGFNDSNYFTSRFHREVGTTPLKYRRGANPAAAGEPVQT
ncbi:helix-turn-helix domain-containing protein [Niveibacterium sp. SC-1]|uniref:helix-turn-helix domain-containing protein n=1 Tax=Niveibacterium sp. SC-1 TaxID=3135646 RepID=UPI00311D4F54